MSLASTLAIIVAGIAGTAAMDVLSLVLFKAGVLSSPVKPALIGRWVLGLASGTFRHSTIATTPARRFELPVGVASHYSIGIVLAFIYVGLTRLLGFEAASLLNAITYGCLTNVLPWFVLFPSYGFGLFGRRGKGLLRSSTLNHMNYGLGLGIALIVALAAGTTVAQTKDARPLHIYVPGSHTVNAPFVAADFLAGVRFFVDQQNAKGGILGRPLVIVVQDDQADVTKASANAQVPFADPDHLVTVGHNFSKVALPIGKLYAEKKKLFFTPYATSSDVSKIGGTVFQLCYNDDFQGKTLSNVAVNRLKAKRIAVLTNRSDPYSEGLSGHFMTNVRAHKDAKGVEMLQIDYVTAMMNVTDVRDKVLAFKADLVFLPEQKVPAAEIVRTFQDGPLARIPILGGDGWGSEHANIGMYFTAKRPTDAAPYLYTYHWVSALDTPMNKTLYPALSKAMSSRPLGPGVLSYEGLVHLAAVAAKIKTVDNVKLAKALRGSTFQGTTGSVRFDESGATVRDLVLVRLGENGVIIDAIVSPDGIKPQGHRSP